jgi:hypothetical protein
MLSVLTHSGARFSSAYFMAPKVRVTAAKNGENCTARQQRTSGYERASESSAMLMRRNSFHVENFNGSLTVRSRLEATDMAAALPAFLLQAVWA